MESDNMIVYEFESVRDLEGNDVSTKMRHANPVQIVVLTVGRGAIFQYADKPDRNLATSTVEHIFVSGNHITIATKNTVYTLKAHFRGE